MPACGECSSPMRFVQRGEGERGFWGCTRYPECRGTHGAHPDGTPLGKPADAATRQARVRAHAAFDRLWDGDDAPMARGEAYRWMRYTLGLTKDEAHIAEFEIDRCEELIKACASPTFEVRWVDTWNRVYVKVAHAWFCADACLMADVGCASGDDYIVWDWLRRRVYYDSRLLWRRVSDEGTKEEPEPAVAVVEPPSPPPPAVVDEAKGYPSDWDDC